MYNVIIKDFANLTFNRQKNILTIKLLAKKYSISKIEKLYSIIAQLISDDNIILILDNSNSSFLTSEFRRSFLNKLRQINVTDLIIVSKNKLQNVLYSIFRPFSVVDNDISIQMVRTLEEAINFSNNL